MITPHQGRTEIVIYALVDPRTDELRYVGKTTGTLAKKISRMRKSNYNLPSVGWIKELAKLKLKPSAFVLEQVPRDGDWKEYEQFWIAYFKSLGSSLLNLSIGGGGATGCRYSSDINSKKGSRGPRPHMRHPKSPQTVENMRRGALRRWKNNLASRQEASRRSRGKIYINNGLVIRAINREDAIPEGWDRGALPNPKKSRKFYTVTDGIHVKQINIGEVVPDGWKRGALSVNMGTRLILSPDGLVEKRLKPGEPLPEGWKFGGKSRNAKARK